MACQLFRFSCKIYLNDGFQCRCRFIWYLVYSSVRSSFWVDASLVESNLLDNYGVRG